MRITQRSNGSGLLRIAQIKLVANRIRLAQPTHTTSHQSQIAGHNHKSQTTHHKQATITNHKPHTTHHNSHTTHHKSQAAHFLILPHGHRPHDSRETGPNPEGGG